MKHGSLFSGIGGFDLASQWMGWENVFHCEWNEFGQKVLKHHFPKSISYNDITKTDFSIHRGEIDILTGGFPCQPYSVAGKRLGKEDERHLWPEMLRAIREIQPRYVLGENVGGILSWSRGLVFEEVQTDLESEGYEVWTFILPACGVNAPHKRDRVWFVANSTGRRINGKYADNSSKKGKDGNRNDKSNSSSTNITTNPNDTRCKTQYDKKPVMGEPNTTKAFSRNSIKSIHPREGWQNFPTQSPLCGGNDGIPTKLDGITFPKWRNESIKAYGNAIVPQVAFEIFKAIELTENNKPI